MSWSCFCGSQKTRISEYVESSLDHIACRYWGDLLPSFFNHHHYHIEEQMSVYCVFVNIITIPCRSVRHLLSSLLKGPFVLFICLLRLMCFVCCLSLLQRFFFPLSAFGFNLLSRSFHLVCRFRRDFLLSWTRNCAFRNTFCGVADKPQRFFHVHLLRDGNFVDVRNAN